MQASTGGHVEPESDAQTQSELRRWLYRFDCPDSLSLGEYQLDLLETDARVRVAGHASDCDECRSELQVMRQYLIDPTTVQRSLTERVRHLATSLFTPAAGLAYGGLRGEADSTTRVFETQDVTITVAPGLGSGTLIGLVVTAAGPPDVGPDAEVRLVTADGSTASSALDDLGHFEFADLRTGVYALEVELTTSVVVVEKLRVE
jgi:hypothetical protein